MTIVGGFLSTCALCKRGTKLLRSHLMPKFIYKRIVGSFGSAAPSAALIDLKRRTAISTTAEFAKKLLCVDCEKLFDSRGEFLSSQLVSTYSDFPFLSFLNKESLAFSGNDLVVFDPGKIDQEKINALTYMAISIIWRACVWNDNSKDPKAVKYVKLGAQYERSIREYLLGGKFPDGVHLAILIHLGDEPAQTFTIPSTTKADGYYEHRFVIPGFEFIAFVSGSFSGSMKDVFSRFDSNVVVCGQNYLGTERFKLLCNRIKSEVVNKGILSEFVFNR